METVFISKTRYSGLIKALPKINNMNDRIPVKPMVRILSQYVQAHNLPFRMNRWEEIVRAFHHYNQTAKYLN
jgi:hypothetical protein